MVFMHGRYDFRLTDEERGRLREYLQRGGTVLAGGTVTYRQDYGPVDFVLVRLDPTGAPDASYRGAGMWTTDFASGDDDAYDVALQQDGKIVAAGESDHRIALARYEVKGGPRDADADGVRRIVRHLLTNTRMVEVAPDRARVESYFTVVTEIGLDHHGRYRDVLVPVGDDWLIRHRLVSTDWRDPRSTMAPPSAIA